MPPNPPDRFAPIPDTYVVAAALAKLVDDWMPEYLAAIERRDPDLQPGQSARPRPARIRHAGIWRRGEPAPAVVVWPAGLRDEQHDPTSGAFYATVQLGLMFVAQAKDEDATARLVQRYASAARALMLQRPITVVQANGDSASHALRWRDEDYMGADIAEEGRTRASVRFAYDAPRVYLGNRGGGPPPDATPRPDPTGPWPAGPDIDTVFPPDVLPTRTPLG